MNENLNFAIREGGKTVGAGVVTKMKVTLRSVVQLVERRSPKPEVVGSSPSAPAKLRKSYEKSFKIYSRGKTRNI